MCVHVTGRAKQSACLIGQHASHKGRGGEVVKWDTKRTASLPSGTQLTSWGKAGNRFWTQHLPVLGLTLTISQRVPLSPLGHAVGPAHFCDIRHINQGCQEKEGIRFLGKEGYLLSLFPLLLHMGGWFCGNFGSAYAWPVVLDLRQIPPWEGFNNLNRGTKEARWRHLFCSPQRLLEKPRASGKIISVTFFTLGAPRGNDDKQQIIINEYYLYSLRSVIIILIIYQVLLLQFDNRGYRQTVGTGHGKTERHVP